MTTVANEPSGDYYDYTKTMQPERPWLLPWHQKYVYRIMHAMGGGTGTYSEDPVMAAARPPEHRYIFGDGAMRDLYLTFEDGLKVIKRVHDHDLAGEHVHGIRVDRFIGLQPHTASQMEHIQDVPDTLMCGTPAHFGFESTTEPAAFQERFWLQFLPWFYQNHPQGSTDYGQMIDGAIKEAYGILYARTGPAT